MLLGVLIAAQLTLGVCTVLYRKPADVASAHVAVGALVLVTAFVTAARAARLHAFARVATGARGDTGVPPVRMTSGIQRTVVSAN